MVIVLLKVILHNVTSLLNAANSQNCAQNGGPEGPNGNGVNENELNGSGHGSYPDITRSPISEVDDVRTREIQGKAVSGILILLLKWFKVSRKFSSPYALLHRQLLEHHPDILKFEYLAQLLLDSNYIPLILKLLQSQELERVVNYRCDRDDLRQAPPFLSFLRSTD